MSEISVEKPAILLSGGQPVDYDIIKAITAPAFAGRNNPKVAYIGAANGDRAAFFDTLNTLLLLAGAAEVNFVRLARDRIDAGAARETLTESDAIFLSGGEVEDGIKWINKHGLDGCLKELYRIGVQFIGISAGAIMMGANWVRWSTPGDDETAELFDCLGFVPVTFDTHAEDEDWIELKTALRLMGDGARGCAIPRGGIISADSRGNIRNIVNKYLTYVYKDGEYQIS